MLKITENKFQDLFFCLLIIVLFKPTWLISIDGLGVGGDDLSYWIHSSTVAFDFDLDYKDDHSLDHPNYHKNKRTISFTWKRLCKFYFC